MKVVVMFMSRTGNTCRAAELIGQEFVARGCDVVVRPVDGVDYAEVADADLVCVGTWVDGLILFGHRPGDTGKIRKVPMLWNKPVAAFMTYALHAGSVIDDFAVFLREEMGAFVVAGQAMKRSDLEAYIPAFVDDIAEELEHVRASNT